MNFYQELQLNQAGSKEYIASFQDRKEKLKHIGIYLFKIILNIAFSMGFIMLFSLLFGGENSVAGLVVLLCVMVFRCADLGIRATHGVLDILIVFGIFAIGPKLSNCVPVGWAFGVNVCCILLLMLLGCHNVVMFNHSTLVLSYLLLQGYDVSGQAYKMRLAALFIGAAITAGVFYRNHRKKTYKRSLKSLFQEFDLYSFRTRWQLRLTFGISSVMLIASLLEIPKAMWIGIAAMSVFVPFRSDFVYRVKYRAPGNILGSILFLVVYLILPEGSLSYMGIIGGIGLGLSTTYGWQAASNAFSALSIAAPIFGVPHAILLRIFNNTLGSVYAWFFDWLLENVLSFISDKFERSIFSAKISG